MLTLLIFSALAVAAVAIGSAVFLPLMVIGGVLWLITLPLRLAFGVVGGVFRLIVGLLGAIFGAIGWLMGLLLLPLAILFAGAAIAGGVGVVPVALVGLIVWAIYRLVRPTPQPLA
jgi:hypothetical protein